MNNLRVVLDTNVLIAIIPKKSPFRIVFNKLLDSSFSLIICNELLTEYHEILQKKTNANIASNVINLLQFLPNVEFHEVYFKWDLMNNDPDDNKFVDCAISANVDLIVTNDKHFQILIEIDFPKLHIISLDDFVEMLQNQL